MDKKLKNTSAARSPSYIRATTGEGELVQISVRIPVADKLKFEAAQAKLRKNGMNMALRDVIRDALSFATNYVDEQYG